jgi:thymidylate synthase
LTREPRELPRMMIADRGQDLFGFTFDDFKLVGYRPHPSIKMAIAV